MEARVRVISREIIKPSSQTPNHLKKMKLSSLDQLLPPCYFSLISFYQADESKGLAISNHVQISQQLKQSLSDTLPSFYPLAGRFKDDRVVDCNDAGVEFVDAQSHAHLVDAVNDPNMADLKQYLPIDPTSAGGPGEGPLFLVQITLFDCGGIALGVCFSHQLVDCKSIMVVLNAWAATCREEAEISQFSFDLANYFPPRDFSGSAIWGLAMSNEKFTTRRFVFDKEKLAALKQAAISSSGTTIKDPTRVELVSAFIWKNFLKKAKSNNLQSAKTFVALHLVNVRARKSPSQLLENVFGNCVMLSFALVNTNLASDQHDQGVEEFLDLVSKLRSSIRKINDGYITEAQSGDNYVNDLYKMFSLLPKGELEWCGFSSWSRFPLYEIDYGCGSPVWVCTTALPIKNLTILVSSKCGDNIEAWVKEDQHNLEMLETRMKLICTH